MTEDPRLYAIARKVTDEVMGTGTYNAVNDPYKALMADVGDDLLAQDGDGDEPTGG